MGVRRMGVQRDWGVKMGSRKMGVQKREIRDRD